MPVVCTERDKDEVALPRRNSGKVLHKDNHGLLQRGHSGSNLTGKTMSFVLRQKLVQEQQLASMSVQRKGSNRSVHSADDNSEYYRYSNTNAAMLPLTLLYYHA